jgi:hypothetical protein
MQVSASSQTSTSSFAGSAGFQSTRALTSSDSARSLDRFRSPATETVKSPMTSVQAGQAARESDMTGQALKVLQGMAKAFMNAVNPHSPISVSSTVTRRQDGTKVTTVYIDVKANFRVDGGSLPKGRTEAAEAKAIETRIENDFSKQYTNKDGSITRYVARVDMTVGKPTSLAREQFVLVTPSDSRLGGGLGIAPGFETGRTAYISDAAGARTAPHEFGHLAGLRHTAQVDQGCVTEPGISIDNLMSQTGCSPTSQKIERSQLQQIYNNPVFR